MRFEFEYQGKVYKGEDTNEQTQQSAVDMFYGRFEDLVKLKMVLDDGSIIIMGENALKSGILRIRP